MNTTCKMCGDSGEKVFNNGKYYCASCGNEVETVTSEQNKTVINAICPICKNPNNNYLDNGKFRCALCGSSFDIQQQYNYSDNSGLNNDTFGGYSNSPYNSARRTQLEKQKSKKLFWGIVWLFLCWPISIYFFYKMYQISQEISRL